MSSAERHEHVDRLCAYPQLKEKLDERFAFRELFGEYWKSRRRCWRAHRRNGCLVYDDCGTHRNVDYRAKASLRTWSLLGAVCDLDATAEGMHIASRNVKMYCSLSRCEYHTGKPPLDIPLKACKGCGEVKYCSRLCQVQ